MLQIQGCKKRQITQEERVKIYGDVQLNLSLCDIDWKLTLRLFKLFFYFVFI